ncbi:MAG: outer membrane beta-barrel protein [candidate division KSB1 bacterium]|nr:outer membrane beta-barrel protein [candidate division KSB1 bacterium]
MKLLSKAVFVTLVLVGVAASGAHAQGGIGFYGVGGRLFYVNPEDVDGTIGFGAFANLGQIGENMNLEAALDYWSKSAKEGGVGASFSDIAIMGVVKYMLGAADAQMRPYVLAGAGLHFLKVEVDLGFLGSASDSDTKLGIDAGAGVLYMMNEKMDIIAEIKYRLVSDLNQLVISVGGVFALGK